MEMQEQPKWYILHTYSGYEAMVKDSLEKLIENNNLGDYITDLKIPMEQVIEEKNGKRKVVERKLLPCYVFIKMIYTNQIWYYVTSTRGVTGFCGPQGRPIPMKAEEVPRRVCIGRRFQSGRFRFHRRRSAQRLHRHRQRTFRRHAESESYHKDVQPRYRRRGGIYTDQAHRRAHSRNSRIRGNGRKRRREQVIFFSRKQRALATIQLCQISGKGG